MIPFIHIEVPTFGLMVLAAMIAAYYVLRADLARRGIAAKDSSTAEMLILVPCLAGIVGAKLYHVLETPRELFAHPAEELLSRYGLAWFGGLIAGFVAWVLVARARKIPLLESFDAGSAAAALGYGVGRIGCLLSGDGDYGVPTSLPWGMSFPNGLVPTTERVHPTPIYELIVACAITWVLWRVGARQIELRAMNESFLAGTLKPKRPSGAPVQDETVFHGEKFDVTKPTSGHPAVLPIPWLRPGGVFAAYLILTGAARFLVEFIRINPRSFFGLTNAQAAAAGSMVVGTALRWYLGRDKSRPNLPHRR